MENIEQNNHEFYSRLAETWWDRQGPLWPIHTLNAVRVGYIREQVTRHFRLDNASAAPLQGLRILDIGCGGGVLSESMARLGAEVTGIDIVERNIQVARQHASQEGISIDYRTDSVDGLLACGQTCDVLLNMEVIEHVADPAAYMRACNTLLLPGGITFVATINRTVFAWLAAIVGAEYILNWLPRGTHQWRNFIKPRELHAMLSEGGLCLEDETGVLVNPLTRKMHISSRTAVNYMLAASKPASGVLHAAGESA